MTSAVEICNLALSNIRAGSINSLTEASVQAQQCNLKYPIMRDRCLRELPWQFNRKIKALATVETEIHGWPVAYQYPVDCLKIRRLMTQYEATTNSMDDRAHRHRVIPDLESAIPYEVFNFDDDKTIGANQTELRIDYSAKVTNTDLYSDDFVLALSHLLSAELAIPIVGAELGRSLRDDSLSMYKSYMANAMATDQNDQYHEPVESEFITIRN